MLLWLTWQVTVARGYGLPQSSYGTFTDSTRLLLPLILMPGMLLWVRHLDEFWVLYITEKVQIILESANSVFHSRFACFLSVYEKFLVRFNVEKLIAIVGATYDEAKCHMLEWMNEWFRSNFRSKAEFVSVASYQRYFFFITLCWLERGEGREILPQISLLRWWHFLTPPPGYGPWSNGSGLGDWN